MALHQFWIAIKRALFGSDDTPIMAHVPVQHERSYAKKLAKARERHGRAFHTSENKARETEASHDLQQIIAASVKPSASVTKIKASK